MKVEIDGKVVTLVLVSSMVHESNAVVYHELNEHGQPVTEHSFETDLLHEHANFITNGHHYKTIADH